MTYNGTTVDVAKRHSPHTDRRPTTLDTQTLVRRFNASGLTVNELSNRLDVSGGTIERLLRGSTETEIRLATLITLAEILAVPLHALFAPPAPLTTQPAPDLPDESDPGPDGTPDGRPHQTARDAEQLIVCTYETPRTTPTRVRDIQSAFGWDNNRTRQAVHEADRRLQPAGLCMSLRGGNVYLRPVREHEAAETALAGRHAHERGLANRHYVLAYKIFTGQAVTVRSIYERQVFGFLANLGIAANSASPHLTTAALDSFPGLHPEAIAKADQSPT